MWRMGARRSRSPSAASAHTLTVRREKTRRWAPSVGAYFSIVAAEVRGGRKRCARELSASLAREERSFFWLGAGRATGEPSLGGEPVFQLVEPLEQIFCQRLRGADLGREDPN